MSKRKRVVLPLKDKVEIIESLKNGESGSKLAQMYGVGTSTISDIKKNSDSILILIDYPDFRLYGIPLVLFDSDNRDSTVHILNNKLFFYTFNYPDDLQQQLLRLIRFPLHFK